MSKMAAQELELMLAVMPVGKWKAYEEYRDSGISYIDRIPGHWQTIPLKRVAIAITRGNSPTYVDESSIHVLNQACIYWDGIHYENIKYQQDEDITKWKGYLRQKDILINSTGTGTLGRAAIYNAPDTCIADSHLTIVRPNTLRLYESYLLYLIRSTNYQSYMYATMISGSLMFKLTGPTRTSGGVL